MSFAYRLVPSLDPLENCAGYAFTIYPRDIRLMTGGNAFVQVLKFEDIVEHVNSLHLNQNQTDKMLDRLTAEEVEKMLTVQCKGSIDLKLASEHRSDLEAHPIWKIVGIVPKIYKVGILAADRIVRQNGRNVATGDQDFHFVRQITTQTNLKHNAEEWGMTAPPADCAGAKFTHKPGAAPVTCSDSTGKPIVNLVATAKAGRLKVGDAIYRLGKIVHCPTRQTRVALLQAIVKAGLVPKSMLKYDDLMVAVLDKALPVIDLSKKLVRRRRALVAPTRTRRVNA